MMTTSDLEKYKNQVWLGVNDIKDIACVGHEKAKKIIEDINDKRKKDKLYIPNSKKVSSKDFFKYLGL
ncbi:MAG: hypothetical protein RR585_14900 [Coprobacillus sp.]